jgi:hypothetical protein
MVIFATIVAALAQARSSLKPKRWARILIHEAKYGSIANVIALGGVGFGLLAQGPCSFRAEYEREGGRGVGHAVAKPVLTEADLAPLAQLVEVEIPDKPATGTGSAAVFDWVGSYGRHVARGLRST